MEHKDQILYSRQIILPEIGEAGQEKIINAKVLMIGAGGLGSSCLYYLACGGVHNIGIIDDDRVEMTNLQRQIIHEYSDIGSLKTESASEKIADLNPDINVETYNMRLSADNIEEVFEGYDVIIDGSDNVKTRLLVNDYCIKLKKPLVSASILGFEGQIACFKGWLDGYPCYRCLYPNISEDMELENCKSNGVFAPLAGVMGCMQAGEALKVIAGLQKAEGYKRISLFDAKSLKMRAVNLRQNKDCLCND